MKYTELLSVLKEYSEEKFSQFQRRLIFTDYEILGVRTPMLRLLAKSWRDNIETLLAFPNEYYEVVFIKLAAVALLPYERFIKLLGRVLPLIDNWALCDSFRPNCLKNNQKEFLPVLTSLFENEGEYYRRFVLVMLLVYYLREEYLPTVKEFLKKTDTAAYYIHMAAAWLVAEVLVKHYEFGVKILKEGFLATKTHDKAIQKAKESYRLTKDQKAFLNALKIKNTER